MPHLFTHCLPTIICVMLMSIVFSFIFAICYISLWLHFCLFVYIFSLLFLFLCHSMRLLQFCIVTFPMVFPCNLCVWSDLSSSNFWWCCHDETCLCICDFSWNWQRSSLKSLDKLKISIKKNIGNHSYQQFYLFFQRSRLTEVCCICFLLFCFIFLVIVSSYWL